MGLCPGCGRWDSGQGFMIYPALFLPETTQNDIWTGVKPRQLLQPKCVLMGFEEGLYLREGLPGRRGDDQRYFSDTSCLKASAL